VRFELIDEFRISPEQREQIRALLQLCFPDTESNASRTYLKQMPPRRLLVWDGTSLVAHMGLEHRAINLAGQPATIFGVIDLCVRPGARSRGVGSKILAWVEDLGRRHDIEFIVLFALDARLYLSNGYTAPGNPLRWVKIHEHQLFGLAEEVLPELMVKPLTSRPWEQGLVDLVGYQF